MDKAAFVIGTSGLISVAETCVKVARTIDGIQSFKEDRTSLYAEYNFEQVRLTLWISHVLGVNSSNLGSQTLQLRDDQLPSMLTSSSPINLQAPLQSALDEIAKILQRLSTLVERFGSTNGAGSIGPEPDSDVSLMKRVMFQTGVYKPGGADEIKTLLAALKSWNDRLDGIVESRMRHHLVTNMHVSLLSSAVTDRELEVIEEAAQTSHPNLGNDAAFTRERLRINQRPRGRVSNLRVDTDKIVPSSPPVDTIGHLRKLGTLENEPSVRILQEWKLGQTNWREDEINTACDRVDQLASMLCLKNKPSRLRSLDLVAYAISDGGEGERKRLDFCFMYRLPPLTSGNSEPVTLQAALVRPEGKRPTLPQRFNIAVILAESVLQFHLGDWLHKAICSSNIIFFTNRQTDQLDFSAPFVAGFEFSRPDTVRDQTLDAFRSLNFDVYCHPDLMQVLTGEGTSGRPRYQRQYDIYGLGVVLLEIGCWMTVESILSKRNASNLTRHERLLQVCTRMLPSRMGSKYKDAVYACLTWSPDSEKTESGSALRHDYIIRRKSQIEEFACKVTNMLSECHCVM